MTCVKPFLWMLALVMVIAGCGQRLPETMVFVPAADVQAMVALPGGGLRYIDSTGEVFDVDATGVRSVEPVGRVAADASITPSVFGLARAQDGRTFASFATDSRLMAVAPIDGGPEEVVWLGPTISGEAPGGAMTFTPTGRLLVALGAGVAGDGQIITLDPFLPSDQRPNVISTGWLDPGGVTYTAGGPLWVASLLATGEAVLARAGGEGPVGAVADLGDSAPHGLTAFGDQELVACEGDGELRRFLLQNAAATPGRLVADDCTGDVVELADGRLAYAAGGTIKVTAQ